MTFKEIDALNVDGNKAKLKIRKVVADMKAYAEKTPISVNVRLKKEKLNNDLTAFLNKNTKIRESSVLLAESERIRELIDSVDDNDKGALRNATDAFSLFKSEVTATGYATKSTTDKIKGMLSHVTKIGSFFGLASMAVNQFRQSLSTLKSNDTILTEISKTSEMTKKQLEELGNEAFKVASKYGKLSSDYLLSVQDMSRAGYLNSGSMAELSVAAQCAGNMTAELANQYIIATDKAFKMNGSVEKLTATLDGANNITNKNAVNITELSTAMSIVGSQAASAGMEVNETTAAVATMIAVTQRSGSEMANAFKGILMNLRQVTGEIDGEEIDTESLTKYEKACAELGVSLSTVKDGIVSLKEPMQIIKELSEAYKQLDKTDARRANLLSAVGGKYRANALNAILENYDMYEKMLQEYADGLGSMDKEAEKTAKSWEGRLNSLSNSFTSFVNTLTNKDAILSGISFFDRLIQGAEALTDSIGEIPVILTALNSALAATNKDYGITQIWNKDKGKIDIQGNLLGIDFTAIKNMKKHFAEAEEAIAKWNAALVIGDADINDFGETVVKNNAQFKKYLSTCSKDAPASLEGYKAHLKAAGVETDALRLKTVLLNAAISMGVGIALQLAMKGVSLLVQKISDLAHEYEKCKERVDELMSSYKSALDKANSNAKTVEELASRYETLSKGVNNLGENVSLATDEYTEYNKIVNQIADMFPTMVQGYTNEGNAILSLKGNVEELRNAYKEAQQEAYNMLIADGKDSDGNDIIKNWENLHGTNFFSELFDFGAADVGGAISTQDAINQLKALSEMSAETYRNIERITGSGTRKELSTLSDIEKDIGYGTYIYKALGIDISVSDEDFEAAKRKAKVLIQTYQAEIKSGLKNVQTLANAYLMTNEDYAGLDEQSKNAASIIVNSINEGIASGFKSKEDVGTYVAEIVDMINDNPDIKDALVGLFSIDMTNMSVSKAKELLDIYITSINEKLEENPVELKARLGFADIDDTYNRLKNSINQLARDHGIFSSGDYDYLSEYTKDFTQAQVELWLEATRGAEDSSQAVAMYNAALEKKKEEATRLFSVLTNSADSLDKFQSSVKSAADAYATLLSGNYSSTELLDSIQAINKAVTDMNDSLDWEEIDSLDLLGDKLEEISQKYAESVLSKAGINVNSDFGKMLTDIIKQTYEAEAQFTGMNAQLDRLQSSYKTLTDILESYNETGHISLDNLQSLLTADENLISMLEVENGKLVINQEAYKNLVAVQSSDFKAKLNKAAAAEIEALALNKSKEATNNNAKASEDAVAKLDAETKAFNRNTSAAIANAMQKAKNKGVSNEEIQGILDKYTEIWNAAMDNYSTDFSTFMNGAKSAAKSFTDTLDKELTALDKKMEAGYVDFNDYIHDRLALIEDYYKQGKIKADEYYSYLEKHYDTQLSYRDKVVNAVTRRIDAELDALKQQKDDVENIHKAQIESLEKEKTLLEEANKERERQRDLQLSLYELERAHNQRTKLVYSEDKGMHYVADDQSIRDAQQEVDNAKYNIQISEIEKSISNLEEARDKQTDAIDDMISDLESYKDAWKDITSAYEEEQENLIAAQILGANWEDAILNGKNGRLDVLNTFKNEYIAIQQAIVDAAWEFANEQVKAAKAAEKGASGSTGNDGTNFKAYASGTNNARKGLNLVGEDGTETYFDNHGHVAIVTNPTLIPMEGGEVVKNERDTNKLLDPNNLAPVDTIGLADIDGKEAEYTIRVNVETNGEIPDVKDSSLTKAETITLSDGTVLAPYDPDKDTSAFGEVFKKWNAYYENVEKNVEDINRTLSQHLVIEHNQQMNEEVNRFINNSSSVVNNNRNIQQPIVQNITLNCPNVTNNSGVEYIQKELGHLSLIARQEPLKKY